MKPGEAAQTEVPSELKMAALSTSPVPTRLCGHLVSGRREWLAGGGGEEERTWCLRRLRGIVSASKASPVRKVVFYLTLPRHDAAIALAAGCMEGGARSCENAQQDEDDSGSARWSSVEVMGCS